ncbi:MAG: type II toxin-antitoxin system RelE/ParE family toxin [Planctomycetia bacterium]|nr:type II toxin-antitoxin system RelE/ParE family toxin [Planctomycetia bacterium]
MRIIQTNVAFKDAVHISSGMISEPVSNLFNQALQKTYSAIIITPTIGSLVPGLSNTTMQGLRVCTIRRFRNYLVFYRIEKDCIVVERILDGRRNYLELFISE